MVEQALQIHVYTYGDVPALYDALYVEIFGGTDPTHVPAAVLVGEVKGEVIGMMSVYAHDRATVYIQASGFLPGQRHSKQALSWLLGGLEYLHQQATHILAAVEALNGPALRLALKAGFRVTGVRLAPDGALLVEIRHTKEDSSHA